MKLNLHFKSRDEQELIPRRFIADYTFSQIAYFLSVGSVIPKLTAYYDIPLALSNLIVGIPSALGFIELFGGIIYNNTTKKMKYLRLVGVIWRVLIPLVLLAVLLPVNVGAVIMVGAFFLMSLFQHLSNPAYNAWMVSSTKGLINQNFYSNRDLVFMPIYTVFILLSGILINYTEGVGNIKLGFIIYGVVVLIFSLASLPYIFKKLPEPKEVPIEKTSVISGILLPIKDRAYLRVLLFNVTWTFFSVLWSNFASVYQIRVLDLNYLFVTISITAASVLRIICIPLFARLAAKTSWKTATLVSLCIMAVHCLSWSITNKSNVSFMFPVTTVLGSIPWAALGIGMFKYQIAYTQENIRSVYFSATSTITGLTALLAGIVSSVLVEFLDVTFETPPFWIIFIVGFFGVLLTIFLMLRTPYSEPDRN